MYDLKQLLSLSVLFSSAKRDNNSSSLIELFWKCQSFRIISNKIVKAPPTQLAAVLIVTMMITKIAFTTISDSPPYISSYALEETWEISCWCSPSPNPFNIVIPSSCLPMMGMLRPAMGNTRYLFSNPPIPSFLSPSPPFSAKPF